MSDLHRGAGERWAGLETRHAGADAVTRLFRMRRVVVSDKPAMLHSRFLPPSSAPTSPSLSFPFRLPASRLDGRARPAEPANQPAAEPDDMYTTTYISFRLQPFDSADSHESTWFACYSADNLVRAHTWPSSFHLALPFYFGMAQPPGSVGLTCIRGPYRLTLPALYDWLFQTRAPSYGHPRKPRPMSELTFDEAYQRA